jgi:transcriptional regulator with XRE-family HTH domain
MRDDVVGRLFRMARIRRGWRQEDVAARSQLDRSSIARIEAGETERFHLASLRRHAAALGFRLEIALTGRGGAAAHLLDEEHAAIVEYLASVLTRLRWSVEVEASYSEFGERGRIDILAHHPGIGELLVVEVKTELVDLQHLFGSLSVKARLARRIAADRFEPVRSVSVMVCVADTTAARAAVAAHETLFRGYALRGQTVTAWLEHPRAGTRLLWFVSAARAGRSSWIAGRRRISRGRSQRSAQSRSGSGQELKRGQRGTQSHSEPDAGVWPPQSD